MTMIVNSIILKSNAARYENAIRAIAGIASMNLENPDLLKSALAILDREGSNLKFHGSKLIVLGLNDYTFTASVKKACPDKAAAGALIKQVSADPKAVLKLNGAQLLMMRLRQSTEADAATLRRVAERFKHAAAKFVPPAQGNRVREQEFPYDYLVQAEGPFELILRVAYLATVYGLLAFADSGLFDFLIYIAKLVNAWEACQEAADTKRAECLTAARHQMTSEAPGTLTQAAEVQCGFEWARQSAQCLLTLKMNLPAGVYLPAQLRG